jgi:transmembrane sensor
MISEKEQVRARLAEEAGEWFVTNDDGPLDAQQSAALVGWLQASPAHVEAFLSVSVIARDLGEACAGPEESLEALIARARAEDEDARVSQPLWPQLIAAIKGAPSQRWQSAAVMMAALGVVSLGLLLLWKSRPAAQVSAPADMAALRFETRHGEQQTYRLADNSVLDLNTDSTVTVRYGKSDRLVELTSGEADFEVTHDPKRAFRVLAGSAEVVDLGTRFDVRLEPNSAVVTVVEGRVAVGPSPRAGDRRTNSEHEQLARFVELGANQQISVIAGEWPARPETVDAQRTTAWLHRQIAFDHQPLERVAAEFNRYSRKPIEITTPALRNLEISGVFGTDDSQAFIAFLRSLEGVRVEVTATRIRVSQD